MKILFVTTNIYLPQYYGGLEISLDQLCRGLLQKKHRVSVLADIRRGGIFAFKCLAAMKINMRIFGHKISRDTGLGYPVWRTWFPMQEIGYVTAKEKPDLIVIMGGKIVTATLAAEKTKIPVLTQVHDVQFDIHGGNFKDLKKIPCVANSNYTAEKYRDAFGINPVVIHPFIMETSYKTATTRENVTFINLRPHKGLDIALKIAGLCPDIPFSFVGSGRSLLEENAKQLIRKLSAFPNITLLPAQKDMRKVYERCRIILMPSIWEETYGRVVTEAQHSGIPVVASDRGGLPETVGHGGILLDPEGPIEHWVNAVHKLWQDDQYYAELSAAALAHAQRPEMSFAYQIDAHEKALLAAAGK